MSINRRKFITAAAASVAGSAVGAGAEQAAGGITGSEIADYVSRQLHNCERYRLHIATNRLWMVLPDGSEEMMTDLEESQAFNRVFRRLING